MMKQIVVRVSNDLYNRLELDAEKHNVNKSELVRGILDGYNRKEIIVIGKKTDTELSYKKMIKMKKKLLENFKDFIMEYVNDTDMKYVTKDDIDIIAQFKKELKEKLDNMKENGSIEDYDSAKEIYYTFLRGDIPFLKRLIGYYQRRIRWIIRGKIIPTSQEAKDIEEYMKLKMKKNVDNTKNDNN